MKRPILLLTTIIFITLFNKKAYAYIDPGTGSFIFQMIIAGLLAALFAIKMYWKRIKDYINKLFPKGETADKADEQQ